MSARKLRASEQISKRSDPGSEPALALSRLNSVRAKRRASRSALGVGMATLVTIMVAVLLTVFSVLTLVSARSDLRLSSKAIESTQAYYQADSQAEQWLAQIDGIVGQALDSGTDIAAALDSQGYQTVAGSDGQLLLAQDFPITDNRKLAVELAINDNGGSRSNGSTSHGITVQKWQVVTGGAGSSQQ